MDVSPKQELLDVTVTLKKSEEIVTVADLVNLSALIDDEAIEQAWK